MEEPVIISACRTAVGAFRGSLHSLTAPAVGAVAIREALRRVTISPDRVDEVIMGNVLSAGVGQAPARQAALLAGIPPTVQCLTVNSVGSSGLRAVMLAAHAVMVREADVVIAGGMESVSNAPFLLGRASGGVGNGDAVAIDSILHDSLLDPRTHETLGIAADRSARDLGIDRKEQDEYAVMSYLRAKEAQGTGEFDREIMPVEVAGPEGSRARFAVDEGVGEMDVAKLPAFSPAFVDDGSVTEGNSSRFGDGAAAVVVTSARIARALGIRPLARIVGQASLAKEPSGFATAHADVMTRLLLKCGQTADEVDLFEIDEVFAVVALAAVRILGIPLERVNVNGGSIALGHPIGATGARILVTLLHALERRHAQRGVAALVTGGGEASALLVERE
jgi:acetyl-CoA C-acetyltransferase